MCIRLSTSALLPLKNLRFVLSGKLNKEKYQAKIEALGGKVKNSVDKDTLALVSDKGEKVVLNFNHFLHSTPPQVFTYDKKGVCFSK